MKVLIKKITTSLLVTTILLAAVLPINYLPTNDSTIAIAQAQSDTGSDQTIRQTEDPDSRCGLTNMGRCVEKAFESLAGVIGSFLLLLSGWILGLSGFLLKKSIDYTIVEMSETVSKLPALVDAWSTFRDLANIFFIFIILYIAISTILKLDTATTKRLLVHLIVIALFLNFSLFFTKVMIDASNIVSVEFFESIQNAGGNNGIAGAFMQKLGLQSFADPAGAYEVLTDINGPLNILLVAILSATLFIVVAFVFSAMAIMLIARFVILVFLMILSPLAFIAMALPKDEYSKKWWHELFSQLIFAPAMLAFLWVTLVILNGLFPNGDVSGGSLAQLIPSKYTTADIIEGKITIILNFLIIIGMALFSLVAAKQIGAMGSQAAIGYAKRGFRTAGTAIGRPTRYFGGVAARSLINSKDRRVGIGGFGFKVPGLRNLYEKSQRSEFWNRDGLHQIKEATLGRIVNTKIAGKSATDSFEEGKRLRNLRSDIANKDAMLKAADELRNNEDLSIEKIEKIEDKKEREKRHKKRLEEMGKISQHAQKISASNFENIVPKEVINDELIARNLPDTHFDKLMTGSRLSDKEKSKLTESRISWIKKALEPLEKHREGVENGTIDPSTNPPKLSKELKSEIKSKIKYNTSEKEFEHINQQMPEMFENVKFVKSIPTSMIKKLRVNPTFGVGLGEEIRMKKFYDLNRIVEEEEQAEEESTEKALDFYRDYYEKRSDDQLKKIRNEVKNENWNYGPDEIADMPTEMWKKPAVMSVLDEKTIQKWTEKDTGERKMLVMNALAAEKIQKEYEAKGIKRDLLTPDMKHMLDWMRHDRTRGRGFFNIEDLQEQLGYTEMPGPYTESYKNKTEAKQNKTTPEKPKVVPRQSGGAEPYEVILDRNSKERRTIKLEPKPEDTKGPESK